MISIVSPTTFSISSIPRRIANAIIRAYQHTLSPDHGPLRAAFPHGACKYHPTCSEYTRQAINKHGLVPGALLGAARIGRCHPWSAGGFDPIP